MLWTEAVALFGNGSVATEGAKKTLKQIGCNVAYLQGLSELVQAMKVHANTLHVMHIHVHYVISRRDMILIIACDSPQEPSQVRLERISTLTAFAQESISELAQSSEGVPIEGVPRGEGDILCLTLFIV